MSKHTGGCHCGNVSVKSDLEPMLVGKCNCGRCRKLTGVVAVSAMFGEDEIEVQGETSVYQYTGGSGMAVESHFCATCACRIFAKAESFPGMMMIPIGVLDKSLELKPKGEIFNNYKLPWLKDNGCIQERFEESAVEERLMMLLEKLENR